MGDRNPKASDPERRASVRTSRRISLQQDGHVNLVHDGFASGDNSTAAAATNAISHDEDDEYMLALAGMVSDGFRPELSAPAETVTTADAAIIPAGTYARPDAAADVRPESADSAFVPRPNRSSISKPPRGRDSFTLRHDGANGHVAGASLSRVSSASSGRAYVSAETPYQGPSAPSHPYQMYSQDTRLARTMSVATTSTTPAARPESEYNGPTGPSHPYSMYPQNPVEEAPRQPVVPAIPVGFVNAPDPYQRRIGPEGEEIADIIGPDGHTEELPPYTRYPDEYYTRKIRDNDASQRAGEGSAAGAAAVAGGAVVTMAAIPTAVASTSAVPAPIPGAGGLGLAARNPEYDARSLDGSGGLPGSRHSSRSFTNESHHEVNTAAAALSEKPQLSKYQRFAKRKACGVIPYWALGLTFTAVLIVIIIVGAVIGTLLSHRKPSNHRAGTTNYQDSVPTITVTFDATPIPTPSNLPALAEGSYGLPLNLNQDPNTCFNDTSQTSAWSCNIIFQQAMSLQVQITRNAPQLGQDGNYDVLMISNTSNSNSGTDTNGLLSYGASAPVIQPAMSMELVNDTFDLERGPAWFRMLPYNKTVVVQEDLLSASTSSKKLRRSSGSIPTVDNFQRKGVAQAGDRPWICTWPDTFVEMFIYAEQNSSYASESTATITTVPSSQTATGSAATATATGGGTEIINMSHLTAYPRAVKVKERRLSNSPQPFCVQVEVTNNNTTQPVLDASGKQVTVQIQEIEQQNGMDKRDNEELWIARRDGNGDMSDCGCMWFSS